MGRSIEFSKFPGEELVLDIEPVFPLAGGDILEDASGPELLSCNKLVRAQKKYNGHIGYRRKHRHRQEITHNNRRTA